MYNIDKSSKLIYFFLHSQNSQAPVSSGSFHFFKLVEVLSPPKTRLVIFLPHSKIVRLVLLFDERYPLTVLVPLGPALLALCGHRIGSRDCPVPFVNKCFLILHSNSRKSLETSSLLVRSHSSLFVSSLFLFAPKSNTRRGSQGRQPLTLQIGLHVGLWVPRVVLRRRRESGSDSER